MARTSRKLNQDARDERRIPDGKLVQVTRVGDLGSFFGVVDKGKEVKSGLRYLIVPVGVANQEEAPKAKWHDSARVSPVTAIRLLPDSPTSEPVMELNAD